MAEDDSHRSGKDGVPKTAEDILRVGGVEGGSIEGRKGKVSERVGAEDAREEKVGGRGSKDDRYGW